MLAQEERRRMAMNPRHPVEGRESELRNGIRVPALTHDWEGAEDEFPGQQQTTTSSSAVVGVGGGLRERERMEGWGQEVVEPGRRGRGGHGQQQQGTTTGFTMPGQGPQQQQPPSPLFDPSPLTIEKSNVLLLGPSGVGKTLMAKTLARVLDVPFSMSDCTPFTQAGYIGEDAEVCVQRLLAAANYDVARAERGIVCLDEIDKIATAKVSHGKDVSGEGVQQALLKIIEGTTLQVQAKAERGSGGGGPSSGSGGRSGGGYPINSPLSGGNMGSTTSGQQNSASTSGGHPQKGETYNVKTDNILFICAGAFNGLHRMILDRVGKGSIGFGATIRAAPGSSDSTQHETVLEGEDELFENNLPYYSPPADPTTSSSKQKGKRKTHNTLDLVSPQDLQKYGLIPELIGRIPISCALSSLSVPALVQVLTEPRNSLLKQYEQLFSLSSVELRLTTGALHAIARAAAKMGTGARGLRTVMERLLGDAMFETPGSGVRFVVVTEAVAELREAPLYFRRGEQGRFHGLIAAEEEAWEERRRREEVDGDGDGDALERRARNNSLGGAAKTFEEYREKASAAGF